MRGWMCDLLDVVAPTGCAGCGKERWGRETSAWCVECIQAARGRLMRLAVAPGGVDEAWVLGPYDGPVGAGICRGKYRPDPIAIRELAEMLSCAAQRSVRGMEVVVPVPQSRASWRRRGFSPAGELAQEVANALHLPLVDALYREEGRVQASLQKSARRANAEGAFHVHESPGDRAVLLIDDVITTGSTASECARTLLQGGATRICLLAAADAYSKKDEISKFRTPPV